MNISLLSRRFTACSCYVKYLFKRDLSTSRLVRKQVECHYDVLGLHQSATKKEIRNAYLKKTKQYHPDRNPDDDTLHAKFVKVTLAYEVLSDEQLRNIYDGMSHPNVVYQQRRQSNSTATNTNPFGGYQDPESDTEWDAETRRRMYDEFYKTYSDHEKEIQKNYQERRTKNKMLLLLILALVTCLGVVNFSSILFYHQGYRERMDKMTAENAAFLKDSRTGYKHFVNKVVSERTNDEPTHDSGS